MQRKNSWPPGQVDLAGSRIDWVAERLDRLSVMPEPGPSPTSPTGEHMQGTVTMLLGNGAPPVPEPSALAVFAPLATLLVRRRIP